MQHLVTFMIHTVGLGEKTEATKKNVFRSRPLNVFAH